MSTLVKERIEAAAEGKLPYSRPLLLFPEVRASRSVQNKSQPALLHLDGNSGACAGLEVRHTHNTHGSCSSS